jgi:hypothetical protein
MLVLGNKWLVRAGTDPKDLFAPAGYVMDGKLASDVRPVGVFLKFATNTDAPSGKEQVSDEVVQQILDQSNTAEYRKRWPAAAK